jgi:hypothetical protein
VFTNSDVGKRLCDSHSLPLLRLLWGLLTAVSCACRWLWFPKERGERAVTTCTISPSILSRCGRRCVRKTNYVIFFNARPSYLAEESSFPILVEQGVTQIAYYVSNSYSHFSAWKLLLGFFSLFGKKRLKGDISRVFGYKLVTLRT